MPNAWRSSPASLSEAPAIAIARNGYGQSRANRRRVSLPHGPASTLESASVRIAPRIGPAHGVQPAANVIPTRPDATGVATRVGCRDVSRTDRAQPGNPNETDLMQSECDEQQAAELHEERLSLGHQRAQETEAVPTRTKTSENPSTKAAALTIRVPRRSRGSGHSSPSGRQHKAESPGSTHGEVMESTPATNAAV